MYRNIMIKRYGLLVSTTTLHKMDHVPIASPYFQHKHKLSLIIKQLN